MRLAAPSPRQHSRYMRCSVFCVSTFVFGISLSVLLNVSLPLPPSLSSSCLCISIFSSRCTCVCLVVWECVFDSDKKRVNVHVQGNSWYQSLSLSLSLFLSLSLSLSLFLSLSHFLSISLSSLSLESESSIENCVVKIYAMVCQSVCPLISKLLGSKNLTVLEYITEEKEHRVITDSVLLGDLFQTYIPDILIFLWTHEHVLDFAHSPITLSKLSPLDLVSIFRCPSPPHNLVHARTVDPSVLAFSLSLLHRHPYICIPFSSRFIFVLGSSKA